MRMRVKLSAVYAVMPISYSVDLRWRVVWLNLTQNMSTGTISRQMCISERSVRRYLTFFQQTGDVVPKTQRHGPKRLIADFEQLVLLQLILENTGIYLHELQERFYSRFGVTISVPTIYWTLRHMGCSRRVICHIALQRSSKLEMLLRKLSVTVLNG